MAPRAKKSSAPQESAVCQICSAKISRKADLPRHMRLHSTVRDALMHHCPYDGCNYKNLQKSNVDTHSRTHTGEKPQCCPTCDFATSDPGSLTRHRKRVHGYEPKPRKARSIGKVSTAKKTNRHRPYSRDSSIESFTSSAMSFSSADLVDLTTPPSLVYPSPTPSPPSAFQRNLDPSCATPEDELYSYAWTKSNFAKELAVAFDIASLFPPPARSPSPRQLFPGSQAANNLEGDEQPFWKPFDTPDFGILPPLSSESAQTQNGTGGLVAPVPWVAYWPQPKWDISVPAATRSTDYRVAPPFTGSDTESTFGNVGQIPWSLSEFTRHMAPSNVDTFNRYSLNEYQSTPPVDWTSVFNTPHSSDSFYSSPSTSSSYLSPSTSSPTAATSPEMEFPSHIPPMSSGQLQDIVTSYFNLFV